MLDHWLPLTYTVRVAPDNTGGGTHIKYVLPQGGVEIDGYVAGALSIQGGITDTYIDGNFEVNSCTIAMGALEEDREFFAKLAAPSGRGGPGTNTMVNLNFYTGRRIEFLWPSKAIPSSEPCCDRRETDLLLRRTERDLWIQGERRGQRRGDILLSTKLLHETGNDRL
jgi:hypothetical protein